MYLELERTRIPFATMAKEQEGKIIRFLLDNLGKGNGAIKTVGFTRHTVSSRYGEVYVTIRDEEGEKPEIDEKSARALQMLIVLAIEKFLRLKGVSIHLTNELVLVKQSRSA